MKKRSDKDVAFSFLKNLEYLVEEVSPNHRETRNKFKGFYDVLFDYSRNYGSLLGGDQSRTFVNLFREALLSYAKDRQRDQQNIPDRPFLNLGKIPDYPGNARTRPDGLKPDIFSTTADNSVDN